MKTVLFFGIYDREYARNAVLMQGFRENGWTVSECRVDPSTNRGWKKYIALYRQWKKLGIRPDILFVAAPGQTVVWLAKVIFPKGNIVFDAFTSLYDTNVFDREKYKKYSIYGMKDYVLDWYSIRIPRYVVVDTDENAKYFYETFGVPINKIIKVFVGSTLEGYKSEKISPLKEADLGMGKFIVHFHGTYIPLHGIEYIVRAAKLLENEKDIIIRIIGGGQEYKKIQLLQKEINAKNIEYYPQMTFSQLVNFISEADIVLGIFGKTDKAKRVIPNKVFEGAALGKAIITEDSKAIDELFIDGQNIVCVKPGSERDISDKILYLRDNVEKRRDIGLLARELFDHKLRSKKLVGDLVSILEK